MKQKRLEPVYQEPKTFIENPETSIRTRQSIAEQSIAPTIR